MWILSVVIGASVFSLSCACQLCYLVLHVLFAKDGMFLCCTVFVYLSSVMPFDPWRVQGQFIIWLWCYNTIGLQWCCSSSLTLLAPPTGPPLPTLLPLCLSGPCSHQAMYGWPMRRWRPWQPPPKRSVPLCPSPSPVFLFASRVHECVRVHTKRTEWSKTPVLAGGEGMSHLTLFLCCELFINVKQEFSWLVKKSHQSWGLDCFSFFLWYSTTPLITHQVSRSYLNHI